MTALPEDAMGGFVNVWIDTGTSGPNDPYNSHDMQCIPASSPDNVRNNEPAEWNQDNFHSVPEILTGKKPQPGNPMVCL
jgi:hypothetical protein